MDTKFKRGQSGNPNGRPKGAKDKVARSVKNDMEETIKGLGGVNGIIEWAKKSNANREKLYGWYFSMLPKNENVDLSGDVKILVERIFTDKRPEE